MDVKVGGEAQVCRLCGQYESIYIDVFGEEGTRRLLGLKIHSKINILIDETDPLPKTICVQCLGKLEFVCDFQEECLRTQRLLRDRYDLPPLPDLIKEDDGLPRTVCIRCIGTLEFLCDFLQQCEETQQKLKQKEDIKPPESTTPPPEIDKEFNKENVISSKRKSLSPPSPRKPKNPISSPSQALENISPLSQPIQSSPKVSEYILSEIPYTKNQKTTNSQKQLPKIRNIITLTDALRSLSSKTLKKPFNKPPQDPEQNLIKKSLESPKIETAIEKSKSQAAKTLKPVEIRRSLQKFIWNPEDSSSTAVEPPKTDKITEKYPEYEENPKKLEKIEIASIEIKSELPVDETPAEAADNLDRSQKRLEPPSEVPENVLKQQNEKSTMKMTISTSSLPPNAPKPKNSSDSSVNTAKPVIKPPEMKPRRRELRQNTWKPNQVAECLSEDEDAFLGFKDPQKRDLSKMKKSKTSSSRASRSLSESQKLQTINNNSQKAEAQDNEQDSSLKRSRSSSTRPPRPLPEDHLHKNGLTSSSSPSLSPSALEKSQGSSESSEHSSESSSNSSKPSESSSLSEPRRRQRSSSESSSSSIPTSTSSSKRRKSGAIYGTISQLISSEEKQAIEKFYTIDMSVIDEPTVEKNLKYLDKKQTMCLVCSTIYPRIDKCRVHVWGHLDMKPYKCTACDFTTVTVTNIRCHIRKSHLKIKPFECNFCKKRYVTAVLLEEHLNTHSGLRPFKCKACAFTSASRQVLSYHMTTHKPVKDVTCEICGKEFFSKGRMRAHMITHNKNRELMCKYCSHHFSSVEALQKHLDNVHSRDYVCDVCGKATKSRKALHNHQNVHSEAKFKCNLCPNVYKSGHILKEHLLKHEGIRKYKCEVCEKDFAQQSHLAAHMAVHSDKRFKCPGCQRAFNRHDNMKIHTKRCEMFKANPELQELLNHRIKKEAKEVHVEGLEEVKKMEEDMDADISDIVVNGHGHVDLMNGSGGGDGSFRIGQVMVIPISSGGEGDYKVKEGMTVTESVIGLECF